MKTLSSKRVLTAAAVLALVIGVGGAYATSKSSSASGSSFLGRVASHLGISQQKLEDATKAAAIDQVNADLKAGRITKAQADELKARINSGAFPFMGRPGPGFGPDHHGFGFRGHHDGDRLAAPAKYLGLTVPQLVEQLRSGKSLADVAKAQGKSVDGLEQAMLASAKSHLDQAVKDGKLTQAQADEMYAELKEHIGDIVNGTFPEHPGFRGRGGPGPGFGAVGPNA